MAYQSIDELQKILQRDVFSHTKDAKKAAGRALGTFVEIITFYLLQAWGFDENTAIERRLPEYGNPEITHNVEFTLHPRLNSYPNIVIEQPELPLSLGKIKRYCPFSNEKLSGNNQLLSSERVVRNACILTENDDSLFIGYLNEFSEKKAIFSVSELYPHPFAMFECKRVGVEEGMKKGPQTIEKAKQGAYVARTVSSLQKIRGINGEILGVLSASSGKINCKDYNEFLKEVVSSDNPALLKDFTLTVGVVSNHGNWFTAENHNKELKVLAQSYDWLIFLSDAGLAEFVSVLLLSDSYPCVRKAFLSSYHSNKKKNRFTKVQMDLEADIILRRFFKKHLKKIIGWFNIISPKEATLDELKNELSVLNKKNWRSIIK